MSIDQRRLRDALGQFPTGVTVVTAVAANGERLGMTVSSFNAVSLAPPLVLFSVLRRAHSFTAWQAVSHYAIHVLNGEQEPLSNRFARPTGEKWIGLTPRVGISGTPLLPNALVVFECQAYDRHDGGDHEIFVGQVIALHESPAAHGQPLVFFNGRYRQLARAAHAAPDDAVLLHGW
jgi:flavin reductase (DIM6/NTAB) family NADH-FMN oxidoreductase RutF